TTSARLFDKSGSVVENGSMTARLVMVAGSACAKVAGTVTCAVKCAEPPAASVGMVHTGSSMSRPRTVDVKCVRTQVTPDGGVTLVIHVGRSSPFGPRMRSAAGAFVTVDGPSLK